MNPQCFAATLDMHLFLLLVTPATIVTAIVGRYRNEKHCIFAAKVVGVVEIAQAAKGGKQDTRNVPAIIS